MLLPEIKEREYRFKLALRIGLPIFGLVLALVFHTLITNYKNLGTSFYIESLFLLAVSIYFIFYLIYNGFSVKITDDTTKTFTREYLYDFLKQELKKPKSYTFILISIKNLSDINGLYGIKNGDKVLYEVAMWIGTYFKSQKIENFPLGHIKGGEFLIVLEGEKEHYSTLLELMLLRVSEFNVDDIEVKINGSIVDTRYSRDIDYIVEHLFDLLEKRKYKIKDEEFSPTELEYAVINAIDKKEMYVMYQSVYDTNSRELFSEAYIKLKSSENKPIYPKQFMKVINKLGLGVDYDLMVLEHIISKAEENQKIAINILPTSIRNERFISEAKRLLSSKNIEIIFVLFEMEYYSHTQRYNTILKIFQSLGVTIAIDRVGSIHTSFLYLRELSIDMIRFDIYYTKKEHTIKNRDILEGFNQMAHKKGIKTWIKNLENQENYRVAKEIGIDYLQGKYLSELKGNEE
jgi:EAL domain-containing protein (putative c-di-GMP-specific phosphodiesterase class I)